MPETGLNSTSAVNNNAGDLDNFINGGSSTNENGKSPSTQRFNEATQKYLQDLMAERAKMENNFPYAAKLIDEAIERVQLNGRFPPREQYADVYQQRTIKLVQKVHVPINDKKFNYVGKLLGPKGNSLRRLQEETHCKIVILGRFSMKDRVREEELRNSANVKYAHLNLPLHVEVSAIAPPAEAYARIAYALAELRRYLIPDKHDDIRREQFRELMEDPEAAKKISLRQQHQQQHQQYSGAHGSYNNNGGNNHRGGYYRSKTQHHHNDETAYYRNNYQPKYPYVPAAQRAANATLHSGATMPIIGASPTGMMLSAAPTHNGRGGITGSTAPAAGYGYRPNVPYQFPKK